jgi:HD-GYP domain-containing protein (c-di-GMP phosphodiesterase class II)
LAVRLATELGLSRRKCKQISIAAMLHDIGKLAIPERILNKPGRLTAEEMAKVREHPALGVELLAAAITNQTVLDAIRGHHERFDGSGYPDGLAGESISLEARIIAIADCFDALVSSRPYRLPLPRQVALEMVHDAAGRQFDPSLVRIFLRLNSLSAN